MLRVAQERSSGMEACSNCLRGLLKLFNFLLAFVGLALSLFSLWHLCKFFDMYDLQQRPHPFVSSFQWNLPDAWFIYILLGLGVFVCLISLTGHIAAETSNGCCLSSYIFFLILLALMEGAFVAEVFLNEKWEEIFPDDPSGLFDYIKGFVEGNLEFCKWAGLAIVVIEVAALLLALCTRAATPAASVYYDSDDEFILPQTRLRQALLIPRQTADCTITANTGTVEGWPINR